MPPPADDGGNHAFPILAGYIFGKNKGERKLAMTALVTQSTGPDGILVQFVLPREINIDNALLPLDPRIRLREVPAIQVAVIRYSGFWSQANYDQHLAEQHGKLHAHLVQGGAHLVGGDEALDRRSRRQQRAECTQRGVAIRGRVLAVRERFVLHPRVSIVFSWRSSCALLPLRERILGRSLAAPKMGTTRKLLRST